MGTKQGVHHIGEITVLSTTYRNVNYHRTRQLRKAFLAVKENLLAKNHSILVCPKDKTRRLKTE